MIRTLNNIQRTILFHASLPPSYWVHGLETATYLLNILPTTPLRNSTPFALLFGRIPTYDHLPVFGCLCYPNLSSTMAHKLSPRSTTCIFLGYAPNHRGYKCFDLSTHKLIISRHVTFDETIFPYTNITNFLALPFSATLSFAKLPSPIEPPNKSQATCQAPSSSPMLLSLPRQDPSLPTTLQAQSAPPMLISQLLPAQWASVHSFAGPFTFPYAHHPAAHSPLTFQRRWAECHWLWLTRGYVPCEPYLRYPTTPLHPSPLRGDPSIQPTRPPPPSPPIQIGSKHGIMKPNPRFANLVTTSPSPLPRSYNTLLLIQIGIPPC